VAEVRNDPKPERAPEPKRQKRARFPRGLLFWLIITLGILMLLNVGRDRIAGRAERITLAEFKDLLENEQFQSGKLLGNKFIGLLKPGSPALGGREAAKKEILFPEGYIEREFVDHMGEKVPDFTIDEPSTFWPALLVNLLPWVIMFALLWFLFFRQLRGPGGAGAVLSFGKSRAKLAGRDRSRVTFEDVAGIEEAKDEVREIIDYLRSPAKFVRLGARIPRGVLLVGAPGTGKTLLAKAIAGEAGVPFFSISGSDFVEMFVGVGASRVRDLFREAKENSPCIISKKTTLADDVDLPVLARSTPGFSGADLEAVINEAAIQAAMRGREAVYMEDLEESRDKVRWGKQKRTRVMSEDERRITACHEAGHALVTKLLPEVDPFYKATIIPQGMALGATMQLPETDRYHVKKKSALGQITVLCAGRVAESAFCDDISAGAQSDIKQATELTRRMICEWGMSERLGMVSYTEGEEHLFLGRELTRVKPHSEAMALEIDHEVRRIIDSCYKRAEDMVESHREQLQKIAEALLKYEVLDSKDLDTIMAGGEVQKTKQPSEKAEEPQEPSQKESPVEVGKEEGNPDPEVQT